MLTSTLARCSSRGRSGGKRRKVPDSDLEHLEYVLGGYVKEVGFERAFDLGDYKTLTKTHAVRGRAL
eukprot:11236741-Heterocapsa_arctica.AAC.1